MSTVEELLDAFRQRLDVPWRPDEAAPGRVWLLWYDKAHERRVRGRLGEFRLAAEHAGKGWREIDLAPEFGAWVAGQKWFERACRAPNSLGTVLPKLEAHLVAVVRAGLAAAGPNDIVALTGAASLFGLVRTSTLIASVADAIPGRLLVTFPGTHQGGIYRLLDARDGWNYLAVPIPSSDVV
ncbi:DUF1788 domain-containing protein [Roseomonas stagni]|uniref:DUF1788 domain-containing protein n=1 Tax=Falsiroseomonas algicola TaxID=2716930 RepID=A0A6M1LXV8_9PROT|nr:DUF1788 domain-containing protein [Falsiroseomonas algicola]NGM24334.1 DUF1788 domain-containing protein [Falsiroseomonas algicola]